MAMTIARLPLWKSVMARAKHFDAAARHKRGLSIR
jgi:hypothetical protein